MMRKLKRVALCAVLGAAGLLSSGSVAAAVTLTDGSGNPVPVGSTGTASGTVTLDGWIDLSCSSVTMALAVANAGPSTVATNITGSTWSGCPTTFTPDHSPAWTFSTTGAPDAHVAGQIAGRLDEVTLTMADVCLLAGNLVDNSATGSHVGWDNDGAGAARIDATDAASLSGFCASYAVAGTWTLQGAAAGWTIN